MSGSESQHLLNYLRGAANDHCCLFQVHADRLAGSSTVVLGYADGGLSAVDAATGDIRWTAADCHSGCVPSPVPSSQLYAKGS